jgi:hypothetical protein
VRKVIPSETAPSVLHYECTVVTHLAQKRSSIVLISLDGMANQAISGSMSTPRP